MAKTVVCEYCGQRFYKMEIRRHIEEEHMKYDKKQSGLQKQPKGLGTDVTRLSSGFQDKIKQEYVIDEYGLLIKKEN